jgi:diguanylate cyclase (GGDEF)-like protein
MSDELSANIHNRIENIRSETINQLANGLFFLTVIAVPISISRTVITGWQPAYTFHLISLCIMTTLFLFRNKLTPKIKARVITLIMLVVSAFGLLNYGIFGNGLLWAVLCLLFSLFYLDNRTAAIMAVITSCIFIWSMYLFVFSGKLFPGDANSYMASVLSWATAFVSSALFIALLGITVVSTQQQINKLVAQLEQQNHTIVKQKRHIEHQANHDSLTGLPTLKLANDRMKLAISLAKRGNYKDGFKAVNDTYGHDAGNAILKEIASRILSAIRESDTACRIGGDEFIVTLHKVEKSADVARLCSRLIEAVRAPVIFRGNELVVGVSIGAAIYPDHAANAEDMKIKADELMYEVKKAGKNGYMIAKN